MAEKDQNLTEVIKKTSSDFSKVEWEEFFKTHGSLIESADTPKALYTLFKRLSRDPLSKEFDPYIWETLLNGCLSASDLTLGCKIYEFCIDLPVTHLIQIGIRIYLEAGKIAQAKDQILRLKKFKSLSPFETLHTEALLCNCFAEEGKHQKAMAQLNELEIEAKNSPLETLDRIKIFNQIARLQYFLGLYMPAGDNFNQCGIDYEVLEEWEGAAKAFYNAAACYDNASADNRDLAKGILEKTRKIAKRRGLKSTYTYCDTYDALCHYHRGEYGEAVKLFKRALSNLPDSEQGYRRLHILSMLSFSYLNLGLLPMANKYGEMTFELAESYKSVRFEKRVEDLKATLLWEAGKIKESQSILKESVSRLVQGGINTIEEFLAFNRYSFQSALINKKPFRTKIKIEPSLTQNPDSYLSWLYPQALLKLNKGDYHESDKLFSELLESAEENHEKYYQAWALHGKIITKTAQKIPQSDFPDLLERFRESAHKLGKSPLNSKLHILNAVGAYQSGDINLTKRELNAAMRDARTNFADTFVTNCWLATLQGHSPKLHEEWQRGLLARFTKLYFCPEISFDLETKEATISKQYHVSLKNSALLFDIICYLFEKGTYSATTEELQENVWKQSLTLRGWQQKVRNSIQRIRSLLPFTLAPIILHGDEVSFFSEAIDIKRHKKLPSSDMYILELLRDNPMSAAQLSDKLCVSLATSKRLIKKLKEEDKISPIKSGRQIFYFPREQGHGH